MRVLGVILLVIGFFIAFLFKSFLPENLVYFVWFKAAIDILASFHVYIGVFMMLTGGAMIYYHPERWSWSLFVVPILVTLFAILQLLLKNGMGQFITLIVLASIGSSLGGLTYIAVSVIGTWRSIHEKLKKTAKENIRYLEKNSDTTNNCLDEIRKQIEKCCQESDAEDATIEINKLMKRKRYFEKKREEIQKQINKLNQIIDEDPKWEVVKPKIDFKRRMLRIPLAIGLSIGFGLLGALSGIDIIENLIKSTDTLETGSKTPYYIQALGVFFLIGLYPRVFEKLLKELADRLTGEKEDDSPPTKG